MTRALKHGAAETFAGMSVEARARQWVVVDAPAGCAAIGADLSSAIRVTLEVPRIVSPAAARRFTGD